MHTHISHNLKCTVRSPAEHPPLEFITEKYELPHDSSLHVQYIYQCGVVVSTTIRGVGRVGKSLLLCREITTNAHTMLAFVTLGKFRDRRIAGWLAGCRTQRSLFMRTLAANAPSSSPPPPLPSSSLSLSSSLSYNRNPPVRAHNFAHSQVGRPASRRLRLLYRIEYSLRTVSWHRLMRTLFWHATNGR